MATYTDEELELIQSEYSANPTRQTVDILADQLNKPFRSIIAKLTAMGIYQPPARTSKTGDPVVRKEDLAKEIGEWFGIEVPTLAKTGKLELIKLHKALSDPLNLRALLVDLENED